MKRRVAIGIGINEETDRRIDELVKLVQAKRPSNTVFRSDIAKMALAEGLEVLEAKYGDMPSVLRDPIPG